MNQKFDYIMLKLKEIQEKNELENNLLKNQIGELKKENEQLKQEILNNKIKIQSGEFHTEFPCSAHYMNNQTGSIYRRGLKGGEYSYATAVGMFQSVIGFAMVIFANWLSRRYSETSLW